ncbi:MAG: hybrid sensor histidine kinase/response regulator [Calditrichota bacterium]
MVETDHKYTILAVDDEKLNLESIQRTFRKEYNLFITTSPQEALKIFKDQKIDLIIADQRMPEMTGTELLLLMKNISPNPIRIVLSAYTEREDLIDAINRGSVYRYITKPWEPDELRVSVKKALEHYQAMEDRRLLLEQLKEKHRALQKKNKILANTLQELKNSQQKILEMERFSILGKMAGMIIHDLKQPLDIIRSAAETMVKTELSGNERQEFSEMIKFEVERFLEIIQELLDYSRGSFPMEKEYLLISDFLILTEKRLQSYLRNFDIDFRFFSDESDSYIFIDRYQFQRAILNIVRNAVEAVKSRPEVSPYIEFATQVTNSQVIFRISDNGPGITSKYHDQIFNPFTSTKKDFGIGLGLTITRQIVEQHEGKITFKTSPTKGTSFSISLPKRELPS